MRVRIPTFERHTVIKRIVMNIEEEKIPSPMRTIGYITMLFLFFAASLYIYKIYIIYY